MLVLSRKKGEELIIGNGIRVVINRVAGNRVTLGIIAPKEVSVVRGELQPFGDDFVVSEPSCPWITEDFPARPPLTVK